MKRLLPFIILLIVSPFALAADDFPQFRGPNRDGVAAAEKDLLRTWPAEGLKELWRVPLGPGYGSASVYDEKAYLVDSDMKGKNRAIIRALDMANGQELWRYAYNITGKHPASHSNPAVNENFVVTIDSSGIVTCLERKDGKLAWQIDLVKDYDVDLRDDGRNRVGHYGVGQEPLIDGDSTIVAPGTKKGLLINVELKTGKVLWSTPNKNEWMMSHNSIMPFVFNGQKQYVYSSFDGVVGVSAKDGQILWEHPEWKAPLYKKEPPIYYFMIPSPVVIEPDKIFFSNPPVGCMMLQLNEIAGAIEPVELFRQREMPSNIQTPIYFKGRIFGSGTDNGLTCMSTDGKRLWHQNGIGPWGFLIADSMILALGRSGKLYLVDATTDDYKELATADVSVGKSPLNYGAASWSPMTISNGRLILRIGQELVCLQVKSPVAPAPSPPALPKP